VQRPTTRFVPAKTNDQLDLQALHQVRADDQTGDTDQDIQNKLRNDSLSPAQEPPLQEAQTKSSAR
jgi:hypothetical protein